jgi:hypothetical protein
VNDEKCGEEGGGAARDYISDIYISRIKMIIYMIH